MLNILNDHNFIYFVYKNITYLDNFAKINVYKIKQYNAYDEFENFHINLLK